MAGDASAGEGTVLLQAGALDAGGLLERDPILARERLRRSFRRLGATVARYHGRPRQSREFTLAAEFDHAADAVCAALAFQTTQSAYLELIEDGIEPGIGIRVGLGENPNANAPVAIGVRISGSVREALPARLPLVFSAVGEHSAGKIDESDRIYSVTLVPGATVPAPAGRRRHKPLQPASTMRLLNRLLLLAIALALLYAFLSAR